MRLITLHPHIDFVKLVWRVRAAQIYRKFREYYPGAGVPLAACITLSRLKRESSDSLSSHEPRNILVIRLDAMGDLIMATPIFRGLKQYYPGARITALVPSNNQDILETNPFVDRIIVLPTAKRSLFLKRMRSDFSILRFYWKCLRGEHFDIALQPRLGPDYFRANLILTVVRASSRIKYEDDLKHGVLKNLAKVAYQSITSLPRPGLQHEVLSNLDCVRYLTGGNVSGRPEIFLTEEDRSYAKRFFAGIDSESTVFCVAFGAQARRRQWPLERWAEAIRLLARTRKAAVVILCSRVEAFAGERLSLMLEADSDTPVRMLCGAGLRQVAACVASCDLLLGSDSGLAHISAAVGCAALVVSPHPADGDPLHENSPVRFTPYSRRARVLQPSTARYPCRSGCDAIEPHCILEITAAYVATVAEDMLAAGRTVPCQAKHEEALSMRHGLASNEGVNALVPYGLGECELLAAPSHILPLKQASE